MDELRYFQRIVDEVREATGIKQPVKVRYLNPFEGDECNAAAANLGEIHITYGFRKCFDRDQLKAIIAHELGHIAHNDWERDDNGIDPMAAEREADDFAGEHGFAKDSIRALSKLSPYYNEASESHPIVSERIKNLQRFLQK